VSKIIKEINPTIKIYGNQHPPRSGAFEIQLNDKLVFSKFSTDNFPTEKEIKIMLANSL